MEVCKTDVGYVLRLDPGDEIVESVQGWLETSGFRAGSVTGIGAVEDVELGFFDRTEKTYRKTSLPEDAELVQLTGNLAWADGAPVLHAHATIVGPDLVARGGHLFRATVTVTAELYVTPAKAGLSRRVDPKTGLKLIDFD